MTTKPFYQVIKDLTGYKVFPLANAYLANADADSPAIISTLQSVADTVAEDIKLNPITRPRPNEVGNDVKKRVGKVLKAGNKVNIIPMAKKADYLEPAGYPDFKIRIADEIYFLECKTFQSDQKKKSMRSFYCSDGPSIREKINCDAIHILMSFEMRNQGNKYTPLSYRLVDLYDLPCTLKKEWNSSNTELYAAGRILVKKNV